MSKTREERRRMRRMWMERIFVLLLIVVFPFAANNWVELFLTAIGV